MCVDAHAAAIDGRHGQRPQFKINLVNAGIADDIHAQPGWHGAVILVGCQMHEAIIDIVHAHDRCGCLCSLNDGGVNLPGSFGNKCLAHIGIARSDAAGDKQAIFLLRRQCLVACHGRKIETDILGEIRDF